MPAAIAMLRLPLIFLAFADLHNAGGDEIIVKEKHKDLHVVRLTEITFMDKLPVGVHEVDIEDLRAQLCRESREEGTCMSESSQGYLTNRSP